MIRIPEVSILLYYDYIITLCNDWTWSTSHDYSHKMQIDSDLHLIILTLPD